MLGRYCGIVKEVGSSVSNEVTYTRNEEAKNIDELQLMRGRGEEHLDMRLKTNVFEAAFSVGTVKPPAIDDWDADGVVAESSHSHVSGRRAMVRDVQRMSMAVFEADRSVLETLFEEHKGKEKESPGQKQNPRKVTREAMQLEVECLALDATGKIAQAILKQHGNVNVAKQSLAKSREFSLQVRQDPGNLQADTIRVATELDCCLVDFEKEANQMIAAINVWQTRPRETAMTARS